MRTFKLGFAANNESVLENMKVNGYRGKRQTWKGSEFNPKQPAKMQQGALDSGQQSSSKATFKTKMLYFPKPAVRQDGTPILDRNGKQVIWFNKLGLQNIVTITSYGKTFTFKKMQKAETIRDSRDDKSHKSTFVLDEMKRILGFSRGLKGFELIMKISEEVAAE